MLWTVVFSEWSVSAVLIKTKSVGAEINVEMAVHMANQWVTQYVAYEWEYGTR